MAAAAGRWWAVVLAVAVLLGPGRVVANTEGESCLISYILVSRALPRFGFVPSSKSVQLGWSI